MLLSDWPGIRSETEPATRVGDWGGGGRGQANKQAALCRDGTRVPSNNKPRVYPSLFVYCSQARPVYSAKSDLLHQQPGPRLGRKITIKSKQQARLPALPSTRLVLIL